MTDERECGPDLAARVAELERTVATLERRVASLGGAPPPRPAAPALPHSPAPSRPTLAMPAPPADPGQWVNRLGIALVILGAAFGFKYSIDRGWIGPAVRVAAGLALSATLLFASARLRTSRAGLSRMLGGGAIACAYLSIYAAFQLYALAGYAGAFAAMSLVTAVALALAWRDDEAGMATLGAIGGLATPFLLYSGQRDVGGLVAYTGLVVTASSAVFLGRGWRVLLSTTAVGAWMVLGSAAFQTHHSGSVDRVLVQAGVLFVALATWWMAVMRELLSADDPVAWRPSRVGIADSDEVFPAAGDAGWAEQTRLLVLVTPVIVFALSCWAWNSDRHASGWIALSLAAGWGGAGLHLRSLGNEAGRVLSASHAAAAAVLVAFATALLLGDDARRVGLAAEALALLVASRAGDGRAARLGHLLFFVVVIETLRNVLDGLHSHRARFGATECTEAAVVALLFAAARLAPAATRPNYFVAAQIGLLAWSARMLDPLPNGAALVTAAWFANAVALVAAGLRGAAPTVRRAGTAVMALTMGKLFVFDLDTVDGMWRIATFLGFGAVLLALGYAFPTLWGNGDRQEGE